MGRQIRHWHETHLQPSLHCWQLHLLWRGFRQHWVLLSGRRWALVPKRIWLLKHVKAAALPVLRHRVLTNFNAEADQVGSDDVIRGLLEAVEVADEDAKSLKEVDRLMG